MKKKLIKDGYVTPGRTYFCKNILEPIWKATIENVKVEVQDVIVIGLQIDQWTSSAHYPYGNIHITHITDIFTIKKYKSCNFSF